MVPAHKSIQVTPTELCKHQANASTLNPQQAALCGSTGDYSQPSARELHRYPVPMHICLCGSCCQINSHTAKVTEEHSVPHLTAAGKVKAQISMTWVILFF